MNEQDQQMIMELANSVKQALPVQKDPAADELIRKEVASQPDAVYVLSQAVLVQKHALENLHQQVQELQYALNEQPQQPSSFLSRIFGTKTHDGPQNQQNYQQTYGNPPPAPPYPPSSASQGSPFLKSALSTAAGVAGGMFLFEGIRGLFGGNHANAGSGGFDSLQNQNNFLDAGFGGNQNDFSSNFSDPSDNDIGDLGGDFDGGSDW